MAGPSIGTWVKVKNKSGRMTARVIAKKFGGGSYEQGQVITQSEYNAYKQKRAEAIRSEPGGSGKGAGVDTYTVPKQSPPGRPEYAFKQEVGGIINAYLDESYSPTSEAVSRRVVDAMAQGQKKATGFVALGIQDKDGAFEIVAGKEAYLAAQKAGGKKAGVLVGSENVRRFAGIQSIQDNKMVTVKAEKPPTKNSWPMKQEDDALLQIGIGDVYMGKSAKVSPKRIAKYEQAIKSTMADRSGGNWMPVYGRQTQNGFEVVGNQEVYLAAKRAKVKGLWVINLSEGDAALLRGLN